MQYRLQKQIEFRMPDIKQFSYTDIIIDNEIYGRVLRTHSGVKPIFLSIVNKIDLDTAMQVTNTLVTKDSHIPLPTRLADIMTHEIRKKYAMERMVSDTPSVRAELSRRAEVLAESLYATDPNLTWEQMKI